MEIDSKKTQFNVPINWSSERDVTPRYANQVMINHSDDIFTLLFFDFQTPLLVGNEEEIATQISKLTEIKPICVAKLYLPPSFIPSLISALEQNHSIYQGEISSNKQDDQ